MENRLTWTSAILVTIIAPHHFRLMEDVWHQGARTERFEFGSENRFKPPHHKTIPGTHLRKRTNSQTKFC
jgi:hypothetical protein